MSLRFKIVLIASGLTLLGLVLGLGITYWSLVQFRLADLDDDNKLLGEVIAEATLGLPKYEVPPVVESYLVRSSGVSAAQVYVQERLIWEGSVLDAPQPLDPEGLIAGHGVRTVGVWRVSTFVRDDVTVQVGRRLTALQATLQPYARIASPLTVVLVLLSGGLAWVAVGTALRPLEALTAATRNFSENIELPEISGNNEAATLARSFRCCSRALKPSGNENSAF